MRFFNIFQFQPFNYKILIKLLNLTSRHRERIVEKREFGLSVTKINVVPFGGSSNNFSNELADSL